jgi:hypothetical protein
MAYPENCSTDLALLQRSASFALSLGGKELFHTNFIAFLLESRTEELQPVRQALVRFLFSIRANQPAPIVRCWRERNSIDLLIVPWFDETVEGVRRETMRVQAVVIEAKLKSIPTRGQLAEYDKKLVAPNGLYFELEDPTSVDEQIVKGVSVRLESARRATGWVKSGEVKLRGIVRRLLLAPATHGTRQYGWCALPWQRLLRVLAEVAPQICGPAELLRPLLNDYVKHFEALLRILNRTSMFVEQATLAPNVPYGTYLDAIRSSSFRRMRIQDLVGKFASSRLVEIAAPNLEPPAGFDLVSYVHYSNAQPGFGLEWQTRVRRGRSSRVASFGVQIQGWVYRHYVCVEASAAVESAARRAALAGLALRLGAQGAADRVLPEGWFHATLSGLDGEVVGRLRGKGDGTFKIFGPSAFWYTEIDLRRVPLRDVPAMGQASLAAAAERFAVGPVPPEVQGFLDI